MRFGRYDGSNLSKKRANLLICEHPPVEGLDQPVKVGTIGYVRDQIAF